jgi:hypothetical protein
MKNLGKSSLTNERWEPLIRNVNWLCVDNTKATERCSPDCWSFFCSSKQRSWLPISATETPQRIFYLIYYKPAAKPSTAHYMSSEVLTGVKTSILVFWIVTPCRLVGEYKCFRGTFRLHLHFCPKDEYKTARHRNPETTILIIQYDILTVMRHLLLKVYNYAVLR